VTQLAGTSYQFTTGTFGQQGVTAPGTAGTMYYQIQIGTPFQTSATNIPNGTAYYVFPSTTRGEPLKEITVTAP
jgi:hypothetical protein